MIQEQAIWPGGGSRRARRAMAVCGLAAVLAGCVRFQSNPLSPAWNADAFERRSLADAGLRAFLEGNGLVSAWPRPDWDLNALSLAAFYYHPDLGVARAQWAVARAAKVTAGERPNPAVSVSPGYNTTTPAPSPWLVTATLDIPMETAGKRGYRIAHAGQLSEAARLNLASVAWQVRGRVRSRLVDLHAAQEAERLLQEQQGIQAENLRLLERQHEAGAVSAFEVTQAGIAADGARLALRDAERQGAEAGVQLAEAIGVPAGALDGVKLSFDGLGPLPGEASVKDARQQALLRRADILSALAEYAACESALQLEIARQYPDVHLNPGYEFDQGDNKWSLGLTLTLPVLNRNQGAIAEASAKRTESAAKFNALQARVLAEIDRAIAAYRAARQKQTDADALLARVQKQEQRGQAMFEAGEIAKGDLAALRLQLSASALARLDALVKSQQALGQLEDALQSPLGLSATVWQAPPRVLESSK
jgi:outer membrane protein TolC